jgi:type I restriction enzyme R subunit
LSTVEKSAPALHFTAPQTRARRAETATVGAHLQFTGKQQAFVDFVLAQYVEQGVGELDTDKLSPLLKLR